MNLEELIAFAGRHPFYSLAFVGLTIAIIANELSQFFRGYKGVRPAELTRLINHEQALVVDLRAIADFDKGHIPGSKNVLMSQFDPESKLLSAAKALPVVLVCATGATAGGAAKRLREAGFQRIHVLDGGISAWQEANLPLVKGRG